MGMGGQISFSSMDPSRQQVAGGNFQNMQGLCFSGVIFFIKINQQNISFITSFLRCEISSIKFQIIFLFSSKFNDESKYEVQQRHGSSPTSKLP